MAYGIVVVKLMGGPLDGSRRQCLVTDLKKSSRLEIRAQGHIHHYTLSCKHSEDFWDAVYNTPKNNLIGREDGIGGFGGITLDY